ncbi:MAG: Competence protein-like protein [Herbinix sp.]|jgi:competence CoiA-like predicted nuclease|nr:Competence protein-like protein [Herbinix sp.]
MENCLLRGKIICTYDLKDANGFYYEDMVLDMKQAAADRLLTCMDCGAHVYLAAGPIKEPYFAHYDLLDCEYGNGHESEELKKGKRLLYHLLKRSFPDSEVQARFRMENGMYSTLCCYPQEGSYIAVDFRLLNNSLEKFRLRDSFYQINHIIPLYVMGIRQDKPSKQIDWYQNLIQTSMGYLAFLDTVHENMVLKKSYGYRIGNTRKYITCRKVYPVKELLLAANGQMLCDFNEECKKVELQIQKEKDEDNRIREMVQKQKEDALRREELEREQMENYRRRMELEEVLTAPQTADLNPVILEKCRKMIEEGNAHLVSKKYYEAIMGKR